MQQGFELDVLVMIPGSFTAAMREPFTTVEVVSVRTITGVKAVAPLMTFPKSELKNHENKKLSAFTVSAVNFTEMKLMIPDRFVPLEGLIPDPEENGTIVLGYKTCFLNETTRLVNVGENVAMTMKIEVPEYHITINKNVSLRVAAILEKSGTPGITNFDYWAFISTKTALQLVGKEAYNIILVKVSDPKKSEQVANAIEDVFENPYSISILVPIAFMRQVDRILDFVQMFLMAIASISLLVAGIGIMNIMTVSVMERTREIGILKAIGAKSRTVLTMFLSEAVLIGLIGGLIGVFTGYGSSYALASILSNFMQPQQQNTIIRTPETRGMSINPVFSPQWTIVALIFAVIVCIIFALYPARKAAKLDPLEALRYE
jgi:ABC-type antimicrobial peptide transport system permease subunit